MIDEIVENRLQELRARILDRLSKPCDGRYGEFHTDSEFTFNDDVRLFRQFVGESFLHPAVSDSDIHYLNGLLDEIEWAENSVHSAWAKQDDAIERSRFANSLKQSPPKHHPNQTTFQ